MALTTGLAVVVTPALAEADVGLVNQQRAAAGLAPVAQDPGLTSLAQQHSARMAASSNLVHSANLGGTVGSVLSSFTGAAENVGQGPSVGVVNSLFMGSSTHRSAILGNFNVAGVGVATGPDGRVWVTQLFARAGGGQVLSSVARPAAGRPAVRRAVCRTRTRAVTRVVRGKRVRRLVRTSTCARKVKRKSTRRRTARRVTVRRVARRR